MPRFFAIVLLAVATMSLCVSCTRSSPQASLRRTQSWTIPGVLRIGVRQEPDTLNPLLAQQEIDVDISMFWAGYLIGIDDRNHPLPELAVAVPSLENGGISKDGRTIVYRLRHGVRWHDGAPFTADDVIFTWRAVMNADNPVPSRVGYELIQSIERRSDDTVIVRLRRPYAPFVSIFLSVSASYPYCVLPKHMLARYHDVNHAAFNTMPLGTGPYRVVRYEPHNLIRFEANAGYWRGRPRLKQIDMRIVPNDNTLATLMRTHELDLYFRVPHIVAKTLRGREGVTIVSSPFTRYVDIGFNTRSDLLSDVRVRRAIALATDKRALNVKVALGADIITDSDQPRFSWAHADNLPQYAYDPRRATALLEAAGWHLGADGVRRKGGSALRLNLAGASGDSVSIQARELLQAQWRQVGVDSDIKSYPSNILFASLPDGGVEMTGHYDAVLESFANGADPDESVLFECRWQPPAGENVYRFCDRALDQAEEAALRSNVEATRKAAYAQVQNILASELPILPLWFERYDFAVNSNLRNFVPAHVASPFWNTWMWQI
ncbi:MAG: peptide ABC transporter substrate-binding protein [Candidatus Eremiobacter antarcticus]|nr:peptide ABC transporter substrate-binding protein [Candidatus Eremiobacteraeota bacterium]MBC5807624.1 peptide ABC transporter substrate-binding protein [Candidatus Eremiobacteraeota bacterium]